MTQQLARLSREELEAQHATALPAKEVASLLDLNVLLDLGLDVAAPIDLAVAANANVAAPINAGVSANVLSFASTSGALAQQESLIDQQINADAIATATQEAGVDQTAGLADSGTAAPALESPTVVPPGVPEPAALLDGPLLNANVDVNLDANLAAPIAGAVALNANVAAPINAAASANVLSIGSESTAIAQQASVITQSIEGVAEATADQEATVSQ